MLMPVVRTAAVDAVGNPNTGNGWDSSGAITVTVSGSHPERPAIRTIDGSGIDAGGALHQGSDVVTSDPGPFMWLSSLDTGPVSRGGTVTGSHWIQFAFDQPHDLGEMWIWNYNEKTDVADWTVQGMREVTIQYSVTGSSNPADWTVMYEGVIPRVTSWTPEASPWNAPVSKVVGFGGATARYVVITAAQGVEQNWAGGGAGAGYAGLSEVRFVLPPPPPVTLTIASNGLARAFVVVDAGAGISDQYAAEELADFLGRVTGAAFPVFHSLQPGGSNLLVGPDAARLADPAFTTAGLGGEGIVLRNHGNHLILAGAGTRGTLYAVYTFLEDHVGIHWWTLNASTIPHLPTLVVNAMDTQYVPPFESRATNYGLYFSSYGDWAARNKFNGAHHELLEDKHGGTRYKYVAVAGHSGHSAPWYLPPDRYFDDHPDWYALYEGQRDTRGLNLLNEDMRQEFMNNIRTNVLANPHTSLVSISLIDDAVFSQDVASQAVISQEGSPAGLMLRFVNAIAADLELEFPGLMFETLAYQETFQAPLITRPRSNVIIRLTDIHSSYSVPLSHPLNAEFNEELADWLPIADTIYMWDYVVNFCFPDIPHPNLRVLGPNLQFMAENGVTGVFEEAAQVLVEMIELRCWLLGKLLWNPYQDTQQLIEMFANGYYGPAGPHVVDYLDVIHDAVETAGDYLDICSPPTAGFLAFDTVNEAWAHLLLGEAAVSDDPILLERIQDFMEPARAALAIHGLVGEDIVRASSSHVTRTPAECFNGSGLTIDGLRHISLGFGAEYGINAWISAPAGAPTSRGGTAQGSHWIEFVLDEAQALDEMWIWNYHEYIPSLSIDFRSFGCRQVTIQYSITGSGNPADWTTVFAGEILMTPATAEAPVSRVVDFNGAVAKHVVITTAAGASMNWSGGGFTEVGLSEVRFVASADTVPSWPGPAPNVVALRFAGYDGYDYGLEVTTDPRQPTWSRAGILLHSTGGTVTARNPAGSSPNKSYRVVVEE